MKTKDLLFLGVPAGALMPDAQPGYGLPIGGVLATENTVIPSRRLKTLRPMTQEKR